MNDDKQFTKLPEVKAPLEKILELLKKMPEQQGAGSEIVEVIRLVQKFMQELEHEKANALYQLIRMASNMEGIKFHRGRLALIKTLQRDFAS